MPKQKDLKRVIRTRMQKTGESYTAARLQVLAHPGTPKKVSEPAIPDYAALAGMSDEAIRKGTGCNWKQWVGALDYVRAYEMPHRDIAVLVKEKFNVPDWWCQTVTVGYERIHGLRAIGQRRDGGFETNKSKTVSVPVVKLYAAFKDSRKRNRWLGKTALMIRSAREPKAMRIRWEDGTTVIVGFTPKGENRSQVAIQHGQLASREEAGRMKAFWGERLEILAAMLAK